MEENMNFEELREMVSICIDEIVRLKQEKEEQRQVIEALVASQKSIVSNIEKMRNDIAVNMLLVNNGANNIKYELNDPRVNKSSFLFPKICPIEESLKELIDGRKSMARFGDGEFAIMSGVQRHKFQGADNKLADRLKAVITSKEDGLMIAIADNYGSLEQFNKGGRQSIRMYMTEEVRKEHWELLDQDRVYHNTYISRPYALFADNMTDAPRFRFDALKKIWDKRNVIFVEGSLSRLGVGNDLFDNAAQIQRIEAPPENAFDKYDEILAAALKNAKPDTLFLIALGPTAGVLAYDLYQAGFQAIDIGHVDLEYEWYLKGTGGRCEVKTKYNNEFTNGDIVEDIHDPQYLKEILITI